MSTDTVQVSSVTMPAHIARLRQMWLEAHDGHLMMPSEYTFQREAMTWDVYQTARITHR